MDYPQLILEHFLTINFFITAFFGSLVNCRQLDNITKPSIPTAARFEMRIALFPGLSLSFSLAPTRPVLTVFTTLRSVHIGM